jgi:replicative DNA helicase
MALIQNDKDIALPFNEAFQESIIGHCLNDYKFFIQCNDKLKPQWFTANPLIANIFEQMQKSYRANNVAVRSAEELMNERFFLLQSESDQQKYRAILQKAEWQAGVKGFDLGKVKKQLTGFIRLCLFKEAIEGAAQKYRSSGLDDAYSWTKERINLIKEASFEDDAQVMSFLHPQEWLADELKESSGAISTGNRKLDFALGGGLFKGETTAIMAPVNQGKSSFMITIARHAIKQGKKVLWLTHEDNPKKLRRKMLAAFLGVSKNTLSNPKSLEDPQFKKDINAAAFYIDQHLTYIPYSKISGMYIEDVAQEIEKRHNDLITSTGKGYDLIVDDYPKKLKTRNRNAEMYRTELAEVYDVFNHIAINLDVHCFVAIQTNREGLKQNLGKVKSDQLIGMDLVDESYGIAQNMGNIITLNRSPEDKVLNLARLSITKSRNDITDIAVVTRTAYACTLTHGDKEMFTPDCNFYLPDPENALKKRLVDYKIRMLPDFPYKNRGHALDTGEFRMLASWGQADNRVRPSSEVNDLLCKIESGEINDNEDYNNFVNQFILDPNRNHEIVKGKTV